MFTAELRGHTKVSLEDPSSMIREAFSSIPAEFNRKVNPATGGKLITNVPTQLLANRTINTEVTFARGDNEVIVKLGGFMPSRDLKTNEANSQTRPLAKSFFAAYARGDFPNEKVASSEAWYLMAYFAACMLTGMLPTPVKPSGQSTIMSEFLTRWLDSQGLKIESVAVIGANDSRMVYTADDFKNVHAAFKSNVTRILEGWNDRQGRGIANADKLEWV